MKKVGNFLRHPGVVAGGAILTGLGLVAACGGSGQNRDERGSDRVTSTTPPSTSAEAKTTFNFPTTQISDTDPCQWSLSNRRPLGEFNGRPTVVIDSRCTFPASDPTGIYKVPRQEEGKELRDGSGEPIRLNSGIVAVAVCVQRGERIQNDKGVGSEWWVNIAAPPALSEPSPAWVPEVHAGFPPHQTAPGPALAGSLPVC